MKKLLWSFIIVVLAAGVGYFWFDEKSVPVAGNEIFNASPSSGSAPLTVAFGGTGRVDNIHFGDGSSCSQNVPVVPAGTPEPLECYKDRKLISYTYTKPGTYTVIATRSLPSSETGRLTIVVK